MQVGVPTEATPGENRVAATPRTVSQLIKLGYDVVVAKFPFTANGKAHGLADPTGFVKLIADKKYGELLGGHLIGPDVSELLPELTSAQIDALVQDGTISGGMLPKLAGAIDAAKAGVNAVHIVDGRVPHAMLLEILTDQAYGTMIRSH